MNQTKLVELEAGRSGALWALRAAILRQGGEVLRTYGIGVSLVPPCPVTIGIRLFLRKVQYFQHAWQWAPAGIRAVGIDHCA